MGKKLIFLLLIGLWVLPIIVIAFEFRWYALLLLPLVLFFIYMVIKKPRKSEFENEVYNFKTRIEKAEEEGNWKQKQILNLQCAWLFRNYDLLSDEISEQWLFNSEYYEFSMSIYLKYKEVLDKNYYKGHKPDRILPFPKTAIRKSILFLIDYIGSNKIEVSPTLKKELLKELSSNYIYLNTMFLDTGYEQLPLIPTGENFHIFEQFINKEPQFTEEEEKHIKTWKHV